MDLPPTMVAEMALARQNVGLSMIKQSSDAQKQVASILEQALVPVSSSGRGGVVDFSA